VNSFQLDSAHHARRSTDIGSIVGVGGTFRVHFKNGLELGPQIRYGYILRLYDTEDGKLITSEEWITSINVFRVGLSLDLPLGKACVRR